MGYFLRQTKNPTSRVNLRWFAYVDHMGNLTAMGTVSCMGYNPTLID